MTMSTTARRPTPVKNPWDTPGYNPNPPGGGMELGDVSPIEPMTLPSASPTSATPTAPAGGKQAPAAPPSDAEPWNVSAQSPAGGPSGPPAPTVLPDGQGGSVPVPPATLAPRMVQDTFSADSNLIDSQINGMADPRTLKLQGMQDASLEKMVNGPDRNAMALDQYKTWEADTAPDFEHDITDATDAAAAHGQIRSGQLTNQYGDLSRRRALDKTTARNRYMQQALEGSIGDTRANYSATADAAAGAEASGRSARNEQRGERDYQRSLAEQAIARRIQQNAAETGTALTQYQAGNSAPDPTGALGEAAGLAGAEAGQSSADMAALIRAWLARQQGAAA